MNTQNHPRNTLATQWHNAPVSDVLAREAQRQLHTGTVAYQSHLLGMQNGEPLIVAMDALLRYAVAYSSRMGDKLETDQVLGPAWLDAVNGLRALLNGDGAVAMERGITTDSKDNGVVESLFWHAMKAAGFSEKDL